jgi:hypothetical protein
MNNLDFSSAQSLNTPVLDLGQQLRSAPEKTQLQLVEQLIRAGEPGWQVLLDWLADYQTQGCPTNPIGLVQPAAAKAYQQLYHIEALRTSVKTGFPQGIVPLRSQAGVDYQPLQALLLQQDWLEADKLNNLKLCELAGEAALQRKWVYFTEVSHFPVMDLHTINALWVAHSGGKFGYSVQRELWLSVGKNWEKLWDKIRWKDGMTWTRYPSQFTWSLDAPRGHLPLSNQIRGVQVINALLNHPAWQV